MASTSPCSHDLEDPFVRSTEFIFGGVQHFDFGAAGAEAYALYTCRHCGTTRSLTLVGPKADDDWSDEETTAVLSAAERETLPRARREEPVTERHGFEPARAA
jgi:hypothetical protein